MTTLTDPISHALENQFGLADRVVDEASLANSVSRFRERGIVLPTFAQLADPQKMEESPCTVASCAGPDCPWKSRSKTPG